MKAVLLAFLAFGLCTVSAPEPAEAQSRVRKKKRRRVKRRRPKKKDAGPFSQGNKSISIAAGGNNQGIQLGGGFGYFLVDGLELGLAASYTFSQASGADDLTRLSPSVTYTVWQPETVKPYFGAVLTQSFSGDQKWGSVGGRAGLAIKTGSGMLRAGVSYERSFQCTETESAGYECDGIVPEVGFLITL